MRQRVQRVTARRIPSVLDVRLVYRDVALRPEDVEVISGVAVTTPEKTLGDLVRDLCGGIDTQGAVDALLAWRPGLARSTADAVAEGPPLHHKRAAIVYLRARAQEVRAQEEVTR